MNRAALILPLFAAACAVTPDTSEYQAALPDDRLLVQVGNAASAARVSGEASEYQAATEDVAGDVNAFVRGVTDVVKEVTTYDPTWKDGEENTALWGPWSDAGVDGQLWVHKDEATGTFTWALQTKLTADADWLDLAAGEFTPDGTGSGNGTGAFAFNFDTVEAVDPQGAAGMIYAAYTVDDAGASVEMSFDGLSGTDVTDLTGGYTWTQEKAGPGAMDFAFWADVTGNTTPELMILRTRWQADGAGRGDAYVTDGDLGALTYTATECWDIGAIVTYSEDNSSLTTTGDANSCVFAEPEWNESVI